VLIVVVLSVAACSREPADRDRSGGGSRARIVSLSPSATEIVAALGATADLVGVDEYSSYPPGVEKLPKVGSFLAPDIEAILRLSPTLVIVDDVHGRTAAALKQAGIAIAACPMHALPDVKSALIAIGDALGKRDAAMAKVAEIDRALDAAAARRPARRPKVLAVIDRRAGDLGGLVAAGPGSWLDELLAIVGGENVLAVTGTRYPKISREEVLTSKPEIIVDAAFVADPAAPLDAWRGVDVPAVAAGRVVVAKEAFLLAPSPRVREALERLAAIVAPP
jgi:iron complex transport system substrate-binding protein